MQNQHNFSSQNQNENEKYKNKNNTSIYKAKQYYDYYKSENFLTDLCLIRMVVVNQIENKKN